MKLINKDFKKVMAGYKAIKTVLKSESTNITLFDGTVLISIADEESAITQILVDVDANTEVPVNLDGVTSDLLNKCKTKDDLTITDKILIGCRELPYSSLETTPSMIDPSKYLQKFTCKASLFKEQLKAVNVAVAKDDVRPILQNVLLEDSKLVAIDGYRIFTRKLGKVEHSPILLQKHTVNILLKLLPNKSDELLSIYTDNNTICISWGDYSVIDSLGEGEYMNWQTAIPSDYEYKISLDRKKLLDALEFIISTGTDKKTIAKFTLKRDLLQVGQDKLELKEKDWTPSLNAHFKDLLIAFNPKYFVESLKDLKDEDVTLRFISSLTPCIVEHSKGQDLILPIRLKD